MKCTNCGRELAENTQFCGSCGQRNDRIQQQQPVVIREGTNAEPIPAVSTKPKSNNTLMLVLAGLGTGIGYILSFSFSGSVYRLVCTALFGDSYSEKVYHGSEATIKFFAGRVSSSLAPLISFAIVSAIIMLFAAISCRKSRDLLKFFVSCITGNAMGSFIHNVLTTLIYAVFYTKKAEVAVASTGFIDLMFSFFAAIVASAVSAGFLSFLLSKESKEERRLKTNNGNIYENQLDSSEKNQLSKSPKSRGAAIVLCIFLGALGIHRFYAEKVGTGILWLLTGGLFGIGAIVDFFMLLFGTFKDADGLRL